MSISMYEGSKVDRTEETNLRKSVVDSKIINQDLLGMNGKTIAGITPALASSFEATIEGYTKEINTAIYGLHMVASENAFKGDKMNSAIVNFMDSVRAIVENYSRMLDSAETQIINSVRDIYVKRDEELSSNLTGDSNTVASSNPIGK